MEILEQLITFTANGNNTTPSTVKKRKKRKITEQYDEDIKALSMFYDLLPGRVIEIDLQDILVICPRTRPRADAYRGLVKELGRRGISLIIKSRKNK